MTLDLILKDISGTIKESISNAVKQVSEKYDARILELEEVIKSIPAPEKGDKGDSVTIDDVKPLVDEAVKGIDLSHLEQMIQDAIDAIPEVKDGVDGKDGENGKDGKDGADGRDGTDGKDGKDGVDGLSPTADEVAKSMEHIFAKWAFDFERKADAVLEKAIDRMPKPKDGRDAIDIDGFDMVLGDDDRTVTVSLKRGETIIEKSIKVPNIIDKGVFKHNQEYEKGDAVTFGGCLWICQEKTSKNEPSSASDVWRLAVKRGRDGREVVKVDLPETVKIKKDGEDA